MASETVEELIVRGKELLETNNYLGSRTLFTKAILLNPFDPKLWNYRASAHLKLGYPELSFTDAARCLQLIDDKLPHINPSDDEYVFLVGMKLDTLYSCFLAAENLHCSNTTLHYIERMLRNSHLINDDVRQTLLDKQTELKNTINETTNRFKDKNIPVDASYVSDLGTMRAVIYPWDDFEPFRCTDTTTQLKELNTTLEPLAPKLSVVCMPDDPRHYSANVTSAASSPTKTRPQLGIISRKVIKARDPILSEPGILVNNRLYGPKCNYCNSVLPGVTGKPSDVVKSTCRRCGERFCSVDCCQAALNSYHQAVCGKDLSEIMSYVARGITCSSLQHLVVLRVLATAVQNNQHPLEVFGLKYLTFGVQETVPWEVYRSFSFYMELLKTLGLCPYRDIDRFDFWVYYTLSNKLLCNIFGEYIAPRKPANGKLFPFSSFFNHSCRPNAKYSTEKHARQLVVAIERIEKGQQVFISYCDPDLPVLQRQTLFQTTFGFVCRCERCVLELGTDNEEEIRKKTTDWQSTV